MAYRYGNREQVCFLPASIEEYVPADDPVRAYDAFVEALDLQALGFELDDEQVGYPEYDPRAMLKLVVYGYPYGYRSSRKLERAAHHNLTFIWLLGGLKPDHKTIARFRRRYKAALQRVLKQCARICLKLGLIAGNTLFVDGTKMQGNCSLKHTWNRRKCEESLARVDRRIEEILDECEKVDQAEEQSDSMVKMREELGRQRRLEEEIQNALKDLDETKRTSVNMVDKESVTLMPGSGKSLSGYNAQIVVDGKNGLIASTDAVTDRNDLEQFAGQIRQAEENLGKRCATAVADAGYHSVKQLKAVEQSGVEVVVPSPQQVSRKNRDFNKRAGFSYDNVRNCYVCPCGHTASYSYRKPKFFVYKMRASLCNTCVRFGRCTKSKEGRVIYRHVDVEAMERFARAYEQGRDIFRLRKENAELPFGHIRRNLGVSSFLLRGVEGVKAEMALLASAFNIRRAITLLGVKGLIRQLAII